MFKKLLLSILILIIFSNNNLFSQSIAVTGITIPNPTLNRFGKCNTPAILPTITAIFNAALSPGSSVVNGGIVCTNACDTTIVDISINGLEWDQDPDVNWIHSIYVSNLGGIAVTPSPAFPTFDTRYVFRSAAIACVGACGPPGGQVAGGAGFYFVGGGQWCCPGGGSTPSPCDNYGDGTKDCGVTFNYPFRIRICNNLLNGTTLFVKIKADSDGNTGCWRDADLLQNVITFDLKITSPTPALYSIPVATNTPITKTCTPALKYQTTVTSTCGNGNAVTWWSLATGGTQIGTGSPFTFDSTVCMAGKTIYAQCCTIQSICLNRKAYLVGGTCPLPIAISNVATTNPVCPVQCGNITGVTVTNGVAPFSFTVMPENITNSTGVFNCLSGASHTVTVTDAIGCTASAAANFTIPVCGGPTTLPISYCQNATAVPLTATLTAAGTAAGSTLLWYTLPTGGVGSATAPTPSTATVGPTTYYVSEINGAVESVRNPLIVTILALPTAPTATTSYTYCLNATATTLTATGTNLLWYNTATNGVGSSTAPTPSTSAPGSNIFYVSQSSNTTPSCESPRTAITVNVTALPAAPVVTSPINYCQNVIAPALTATGTILLWYAGSTGGTGSSTAPTPSTTSSGSATYYVSQSTTGTPSCEGPRAAIIVNVTATPAAPIVISPLTYCQNVIAPALTATGTNLLWYSLPTTGIGTATAPTPSTTTGGATTYYVSQTTNGTPACEGPRAAIVVNITATPAAPTATTSYTYCLNATATTLTATGTNLLWYNIATGGVSSSTAPTPSTSAPGSTIYYVSQSTTGTPSCEGPRTAITVIVTALPPAPFVSLPLAYCQNATATALVATGTNLLWYAGPTGGTGSSTAPTPSTTSSGSTTYYVSQSTTGTPSCEGPRAAIIVNVTATPTAPIVSTPLTYCQNAIAPALTATGTNILWYSLPTTGVGSATAPTPSTTSSGATTYYVSQTTNGTPACEGPRAAIVVNITATPAAPTVTTPVLYCLNQATLPLTATGTNLTWYPTLVGGAGSNTAPTPSSTTSGSTNYYVSQSTSGIPACEGPRALIVVTVAPPPSAPTVANVTYCQGETAVPLTVTATGTVLWYSNSAGGTGSATAPTPNTSSVATTTYYVSQTIGSCESPRAAITVTVNATPIAPVVSTPLTYCQNVPAAVLSATGTNLLWYNAASGGLGSSTAPTPSTTAFGSTIYYVSSTIGICEGPRAAITVNVTATPALPTIVTPVTYCQGVTPAVLTATGTNLLWYPTLVGGASSATAPTPSTTSVGSTIYYVSQTINNCEGPRAAITVSVNTTPAAPIVTNPAPYCQNATTVALTATGTNLLWYANVTGGIGSATAPIPSSANTGNTTYYVSQTVGTCEGPRAAITVTINPTPAAPTVVTPIAYCQNATAAVLTATGTNLLWYNAGGVVSTAAPTPITTNSGIQIFNVSQTVNGCEGPKAAIIINVTATPALPTIVTPVTYCQGVTPAILTATGTNLLWYNAAIGGASSATAPTPSTTSVGSTIYYVSQTINNCEGPRAAITVTVNTTPAAPIVANPAPYCQNATTVTLTATGTSLLWYAAMAGGTGSATAPIPSSANAGSTTYYVSQTVGVCEGPRAAITVTINPTPALPVVTSPIAYCQGASSTILTATGANLLWYTTATGLPAGSATAPTPSTASGGSTTYYVSQTLLGCEGPRAAITVNVTATPALPTIATPVTYCQGATPAVLTATGTNLLWYNVAVGGASSTTAPTPSTTSVGSTIYYVSQTINGCEGPRAAITVTVNTTPAAPIVTNPAPYCQNATTVALTATGTNLLWYAAMAGGTGSATAPIPSSASAGNTTYYVSQTVGVCEGPRAAITVTINPTPALPVVTSPIAYCQGASSAILTATGANLLWYTTATGLPAGSATAPTPSTASGGSTTYYVSQTLLGCEGPRAAITVNVTATPALPTIVTPVTYCQGVTPAVLTATGTNLLWYNVAVGGASSTTAPTPSTTSVGSTIYYVSQTINNCEGPRAAITVTVNTTPAAPIVANPAPYCQNATTVALTATGTNLLWYAAMVGGTGSATAPIPSSASAGSTTYYVSQTIGVCEGPRAAITVTITGTPLAPTVTSPITYCPNDPAIALTADGTNLLWYNVAIGGTGSSTAPTPITSSPGSFNFYVSQSTSAATGSCEGPRALIVVNVNNNNLTVNLGRDTTICEGESVKFTPMVSPTPPNIIYTWRALLVPNSTIDNLSIKDATVNPVNNATYILNAKINGCATEDTVNVNVRWKPIVNTGTDKAICLTQNVLLTGIVTHFNGLINSFAWTPIDSLSTPTLPITIANPIKTTLYTFTVTTTKALYGCDFVVSDAVKVNVQSISNPFAGNDTIAVKGIPHQLKGTGGLNYAWSSPSSSASFSNPFIQNAKVTLLDDANVYLKITDNIGCEGKDSLFIKVYEGPTYYVPNTFTPNGDGFNDVFRAIPVGISNTVYFRVFNRFGQLMFETNKWLKGWDGTFKGKDAASGTYVWMISGTDRDFKKVDMKGTVILIR